MEISQKEMKKILADHKLWLDGKGGCRAVLAGKKFIGMGNVLIGADLRRADLSFAFLKSINLSRADFRGANLGSINMRDCKLSFAILCDANIDQASLAGSDLYESNFRHSSLLRSDLSNTNLFNADMRGAIMRGVNFDDSALIRTDFSDSDLIDAHFYGAMIKDADFSRTVVEHSIASLLVSPYKLQVVDIDKAYSRFAMNQ